MLICLLKADSLVSMIRLLNILFFGLAILFFTVLALAMYQSVRYVNENQPFILSQKKSTTTLSADKGNSISFPLSENDSTATQDELPEIDFAAIDSLLDDDRELDSLIQLTDTTENSITPNKNTKQLAKDEEIVEAEKKDTKTLNKKPENETKTIAETTSSTKSKATPSSYNQSGKYYIAVGAFKDRRNANVVQSQLKKLGFKNIKRIKNNNFTLIRLQGYPKKSSAGRDLTKVRKYYKEAYIRKR